MNTDSKSKKISVDVTILSWDRLVETQAAIVSAVQQKGIDARVIVVDQGSKPECVEALKTFCAPYDNVELILNDKNLGVPGGRNQAAWAGAGKYIVALDNDAEFVDDYQLQAAVECMEQEPELAVLGFRILCFGMDVDDLSSWSYGQNAKEWSQQEFYSTRFIGAGHMILREAFERVSGYDDILFFMHEELDLARRMINLGYRIKYSPKVVIGHKVSPERRVGWNGPRWRYHTRNHLYLDVKLKTRLASLLFHNALLFYKGIKSGLGKDTVSGFYQGIKLLPRAFSERRHNPSIQTNPAALAYIQSCSQTGGMSLLNRIKLRLKQANKGPGTLTVKEES